MIVITDQMPQIELCCSYIDLASACSRPIRHDNLRLPNTLGLFPKADPIFELQYGPQKACGHDSIDTPNEAPSVQRRPSRHQEPDQTRNLQTGQGGSQEMRKYHEGDKGAYEHVNESRAGFRVAHRILEPWTGSTRPV